MELLGYMPIAQSKRWNRQPIPTGPSDDDRTGGGVSLMAVSSIDNGAEISHYSHDFGNKKPATPPNRLRGDAKSFVSSTQGISTGSTSVGTSLTTVESGSFKSTASHSCTTTLVQPATSGRENGAAVNFIMNSYTSSRHRSQSAIAPKQGQHASDVNQGCREYGISTTHSSPTKAAARDYAVTAEPRTPVSNDKKSQQQVDDKSSSEYQTSIDSLTSTVSEDPFTTRAMPATGIPNSLSLPSVLSSQEHRNQDFRNGHSGIAFPQHVNGDTGFPYNQQGPSTYNIQYKPYQGQAQDKPMSYNNGLQNGDAHQNQRNQVNPARLSGYPNGVVGVPGNRGIYQESKTENASFALVNGYRHDSASTGSVHSHSTNGQLNTSTALIPIDHQARRIQPAVGPLDLETPHKSIMDGRSEMLQALTESGQPKLQDLLDPQFLPFTEMYQLTFPAEENGVIAIRNIPYETTRGEIIALLGKSSKILNDRQEPVHIIMDRVTSKTQDAYCELSSLNAAIDLVERFKKGADNGRTGRLGNRIVEVELSSQTNLMLALFPSTLNGVTWIGPNPQIVTGSAWPWENFKGFFTEEEMVMLSKHVENPQRSLFAKICPERPYECMISTLRKIPWYKAEHITIKQRHAVYEAALKMIVVLSNKINRGDFKNNIEVERLTPQLLGRLVTAAMLCPGFSVVQKHNIATVGGLSEAKSREFNQPRFPDSWRHLWTLAPKPGMPIDVLEWYIAVIRAETTRVVQSLDISQRMPLQGMMQGPKGIDGYWGFFWAEANFPVGRDWDNISLAECSRLEWQAIERIITRAIQGGTIPSSYTFDSNHINPAFTSGSGQLTFKRY
ncbi:hypothetical protein FHL15_000521 [Xylaria flabelliformis]|uniref:Uncharacterized protein n=1 Tax=Xylaria flabelliformis TaxID=2512241 RepID=A0A553IE21_9PEZI|nr:hypothetical protein FHL15_000521 [Xylaria flabelliformis]